ncbi:MAG: hypothetical protein Kow0047_10960 [Anaerolineae bacterium]
MSPSRRPKQGILPILLLLGGAVLRLYRLGAESLWYDETVSAYLASEPVTDLVAHTARDIHPPLYYLLLHLWVSAVGRSEYALAFFSAFWSLILLALTYRLALDLFDRHSAAIALLLASVAPFHVWYAQEVRMYTLGAALAMSSLWALARYWSLSRRGAARGRRWLALWTVSAAAGLYTLYYFAFLLAVEAVFVAAWWAVRARDRSAGLRWLGAHLLVALAYVPWLPIAFRQATDPPVPPWRTFDGILSAAVETWRAWAVGQSGRGALAVAAAIALTAAYLFAWRRLDEPRPGDDRWRLALLASSHVAPVLLIAAISYAVPLYHVRYAYLYAAPFFVVSGVGLARLRRALAPRLAREAVSLGLLLAFLVGSASALITYWRDPAFAPDDLRGGVAYIAERLAPGDAVLINAGYAYTAYHYYFDGLIAWEGRLTDYPPDGPTAPEGVVVARTGTVDGDPGLGWGLPESDFYAMPWAEAEAALERLFTRHGRVWHLRIYDTVTDPTGKIRGWLDAHGQLLDDRLLTGEANARVQLWRSRMTVATETAGLTPVGVFFGDGGLQLEGYELLTQRVTAGASWRAVLRWRGWDGAPGGDLRLSLRLYDAADRLWAQHDEPIGYPLYPPQNWARGETLDQPVRLSIPVGVPPGTYHVDLLVYDASSLEPWRVDDPIWGVGGDRARIAQVAVDKPSSWPTEAWPPMARSASVILGGRVRLLGYTVAPEDLVAGERVSVHLLWHAEEPTGEALSLWAILLNSSGAQVAQQALGAVGGDYDMSQWSPGEVVWQQAQVLVPGRLTDGTYRLALQVRRPDGSALVWRRWGRSRDVYALEDLQVTARQIQTEIPPMQHPVGARLGTVARLLGFDLDDSQARPGGVLRLTLYWQALEPTDEDYKVFNHLVDGAGQLRAQRDGFPAEGRQRTYGWVPGEVIVDRYDISIPADAPAGGYRLLTGMYRERDFARLPAYSAADEPLGDAVPLTDVVVVR